MKLFILSFLALFNLQAHAGTADAAVVVAGAVAIGAGMTATQASALTPYESTYWMDPALKTTSKLSEQCGLVIETKIFTLSPYSMLFIGVKNPYAKGVLIESSQATVTYDETTLRYFDLDIHQPVNVLPDNSGSVYFKFHQKSDFQGTQKMRLRIPTKKESQNCDINVDYVKNPDYSEKENSLSNSEVFSTGIFIGPSLWSGGIADLTNKKVGSDFRLELNVISSGHHGMYLDLGASTTAASDSFKIANPGLSSSTWSASGIGLGYVYRKGNKSGKRSLYLRMGLESGQMSIGYSGDPVRVNSGFVGVDAGVRYNIMFADIDRGYWMGKYFFNIGLQSRYVPEVKFNGTSYSGFMNSLLFGVSVGL